MRSPAAVTWRSFRIHDGDTLQNYMEMLSDNSLPSLSRARVSGMGSLWMANMDCLNVTLSLSLLPSVSARLPCEAQGELCRVTEAADPSPKQPQRPRDPEAADLLSCSRKLRWGGGKASPGSKLTRGRRMRICCTHDIGWERTRISRKNPSSYRGLALLLELAIGRQGGTSGLGSSLRARRCASRLPIPHCGAVVCGVR